MTASDDVPLRITGLTHRFGRTAALQDVTFQLAGCGVHGLLGRNGAGKSTLLQVLAGHLRPTSGRVEVFGRVPFEDAATLARICLVREGQRYPDGYRVHHVLRVASLFFPRWDARYADRLIAEFELPTGRAMTKLSRGMLSAVGSPPTSSTALSRPTGASLLHRERLGGTTRATLRLAGADPGVTAGGRRPRRAALAATPGRPAHLGPARRTASSRWPGCTRSSARVWS